MSAMKYPIGTLVCCTLRFSMTRFSMNEDAYVTHTFAARVVPSMYSGLYRVESVADTKHITAGQRIFCDVEDLAPYVELDQPTMKVFKEVLIGI